MFYFLSLLKRSWKGTKVLFLPDVPAWQFHIGGFLLKICTTTSTDTEQVKLKAVLTLIEETLSVLNFSLANLHSTTCCFHVFTFWHFCLWSWVSSTSLAPSRLNDIEIRSPVDITIWRNVSTENPEIFIEIIQHIDFWDI